MAIDSWSMIVVSPIRAGDEKPCSSQKGVRKVEARLKSAPRRFAAAQEV
ncbi:MAG TPA: hypothetical protein VK421_17915 [Pyrinomonadaceae bacterium]|nr:hypothetical protein [Pyrinomonadaceae bacterium]